MRLRLAAAALAVVGSLSAMPQAAHADDWGCEVLLCLASPGSPTQYGACVKPITKLWKELALGHAFPTCSSGGVAKAKVNWADKDNHIPSSVVMTNNDGSKQSYSLNSYQAPPADSYSATGGQQP